MLAGLARNHRVYALDLPGYDGSYEPPDCSPAFTASFVSSFLDAVGAERAVVVGNSYRRPCSPAFGFLEAYARLRPRPIR